jgi:mono/diheme cytochrome c family protein
MFWASLVGTAFTFALATPPTAEQRTKIRSAETLLTKAGNFYTNKKFTESAAAIDEAQKELIEVATGADKDLFKAIEPLVKRLKNAHALLEIEGVKVAPLALPSAEDAMRATPAKPAPGTKPVVGGKPIAGGKISYTKQVYPLLVAKCGRCHLDQSKGKFSFATFAMLEKGNDAGRVIIPGKGQGSRIFEVIESGDMPRGGSKVSGPELELLVKWIDEGALYDGANKMEKLASAGNAAAPEPAAMKLEVAKATGKETVSFSRDIAPVLVANCTGCHGATQPGGMLNLDAFDTLLKGGESGAPFKPGNPAESLLVRKLKGSAGKRMPLNKPALPNEVIAKFEKWIAEGGKFDAPISPGEKLDRLVAVVKAQAATHAELSKEREEHANRVWHTTFPDIQPETISTKNFFLIGIAGGEATMKDLGELAEKEGESVGKLLHANAEQPLVKGRITLFVLKNRVDLEEFFQVNEKKSPAPDSRGTWKYDVVEAYGVILPPAGKEYGVTPLLTQMIASNYVASLGKAPTWFAEGVGRAMAARAEPKDPRVQGFEARLSAALTQHRPDAIINGGINQEDLGAMSFGFVKTQMMSSTANFAALMNQLRQGQDFDQAVTKVYRASPLQLVNAWGGRRTK